MLYRSGDAVALDENGDILFRGRIDDQVKIRGFRVELGEIEVRALATSSGIRQAAVVLRNDDGIDAARRLPRAATARSRRIAPNLRAKLRETLPPYMVPVALRGDDDAAAPAPRARSTARR